jgi:hypothetical protein
MILILVLRDVTILRDQRSVVAAAPSVPSERVQEFALSPLTDHDRFRLSRTRLPSH